MARYGCVFQTGTQYRSLLSIRQVCEFVRGGGLGRVQSVFTIWNKTHVPTVGGAYVPLVGAIQILLDGNKVPAAQAATLRGNLETFKAAHGLR